MEEEDEWSITSFVGDGSNITNSTSSTSTSINRYSVLWGLALTGFSLTLLVALPYLACLLARPPSKIRRFYLAAVLLPLVFAVSALATCLAPRSDDYWGLLQHVCEAWALHSLNQLIVERLGGKTTTLAKLRARGNQQWLRAPPLCCFCWCLPSTPFTEDTLNLVLALTRQFIFSTPAISLLAVLLSFTSSSSSSSSSTDRQTPLWHLLRFLLLASSLLALWGLFILYKASLDDVSRQHQITLKFISIKLLIIVGIVQEYVFAELAWRKEGGGKGEGQGDGESLSVLVPNALLASESPLLTLLVLCAFPLRELEPSFQRSPRHHQLRQQQQQSDSFVSYPFLSWLKLHKDHRTGRSVSATSPLLSLSRSGERGNGWRREGRVGEEEEPEEKEEEKKEEDVGVGELLFTSRGNSLRGSQRSPTPLTETEEVV